MLRVVLAAGSALVLGAVAASWMSSGGGAGPRVAAAGLAELAVVVALFDVGRRPHDDGFGGAAPT